MIGTLRRLRARIRNRRFERELAEELEFHRAMKESDLRGEGLSAEDARFRSIRELGNTTLARENARAVWIAPWLESVWQDMSYAVRVLRRTPVFTLTALSTLALGIGANTAIFSIVDAAILRPLPYPDADRLVSVGIRARQDYQSVDFGPASKKVRPAGTVSEHLASLNDVRVWQREGGVFSAVALWRYLGAPAVLDGAELQRVTVMEVSEDYLGVYGVEPMVGRGLSEADTRPGAPAVVLIGYGFWQQRFGGDPGVLGRTIRLDDQPATVVGVMPRTFDPASDIDGTDRPRIWRALQLSPADMSRRGSGASVYARLRPGIDVDQAERALERLSSQLDAQPGLTVVGVRLRSLYEMTVGGYRETVTMLTAAVGLILLIGCVNVAGLLLARGAARRPELAIRASIGASRARIMRQLLTESMVLGAAGGVLGVVLAWMSLRGIVRIVPMSLPPGSAATLNLHVLMFALVLSVTTSMAVGFLPALRLSSRKTGGGLAHVGVAHGSALSRRGGQVLIAAEIALALVLVSGAALMIRSFSRLLAVDLGFNPAASFVVDAVPVGGDAGVKARYYPQLVKALREHPAVAAVGATSSLPLGGVDSVRAVIVNGEIAVVSSQEFLPDYFQALGLKLRAGRFPSEADRTMTPPAAVLSERAALELFRGANAVGRIIEAGRGGASFQVVGIVGDFRKSTPSVPARAELFILRGDKGSSGSLSIVVRPHPGVSLRVEELRRIAQSLGTRVYVERIRRGSDLYRLRIDRPRRQTLLLGLCGSVGLLLALVGVFGVTAYTVARRTREIGVRMALGASRSAVVRAMLRDSMWAAAIGIVAGIGMSAAASRVIASFLFETKPRDPSTLAVAAVALAAAAFLAALLPASRAAAIDPVTVLRTE